MNKKYLFCIVHRGMTYCEVKETTPESMAEWIDYLADEGKTGKYVMNEGWEVKGNGVKGCIVFPRSVLKECVFKYSEIW